ncbi:MAG: MATE family efflux transporter [Lachnospiraceae bacterium]|nr:MATE family efflux transporter [Lachnospiraceae bacterium]
MELDMTKGRPAGLIFRFVMPIVLGNIFQQLYNMADAIIVGRFVGSHALAAVGATGTITFLIIGFMTGMTSGFTVLTAQRFGAGDIRGMKRSVANGAILSVMITVVLTIVGTLGMRGLLKLMNTPADIFEDAHTYIWIICAGLWANTLYNLLASYLRSVGNSKVPLYFLMLSAGMNVVLDLIFIIVFQMGVSGAAWATVISQGVSGLLCLLYIARAVPLLHPEKGQWKLDAWDSRNQIRVGIPMALQFSITAVGTIIMQAALNLFGSTAVAAYTAAGKLCNVATQPLVAMGQAIATYAGQNSGKGDWDRIRQGVKASVIMSSVYAVVSGILLAVVTPYGVKLFVSENLDQIMGYAQTYINICCLFFIPLGLIFIYRNILQGSGFGFLPMMGGVVELFSRVAAAFVAVRMNSYVGVCFCDASAWLTAGVFLMFSYYYIMKTKVTVQS